MAKRPLPKPPGKLVLIEWRDACSPARKWHDEGVCKNYRASTCHSVGWLTRGDKDTTVLVASYGDDEIGDMTAIPSGCVVRVTRLSSRKK